MTRQEWIEEQAVKDMGRGGLVSLFNDEYQQALRDAMAFADATRQEDDDATEPVETPERKD